ncbi:dihydroxy-acid dehydratase [Mycobacterium sp.]|uniref:dihydroxy-acid dehydratase n=1 Tax=Mycobacterium sp. TaxID=1785 RepID=UPI002B7BB0A3|nr:dihydroxy-acid dehydratase [Mycobacterium sp.]HTQ23041.1 dihydroxy-acid dehydratase [Mycobacterium sp.]
MTTEPIGSGDGHSPQRPRRDATAGGGPPVTGDHFAGDAEGTILRAFLRAGGLSKEEVRRRPIIGICSSFSELNPCNMGLRDLAEAVRRGVTAAGGTAVVFPTISLNENMLKPTSMLLRNLMAMDVEEMIRCSPIDGVVLLAGCDKTVPAQLMGAASAGKPAIMLTAGPRSCGFFQGRSIVTTDIWDLAPDRFAGRIDDQEWDELEGTFAPTVGVCNVMGTATTMAIAAEVLGMALPGSAAVPAVESRRRDLGERTGVRAVELARDGIRPDDRMTAAAFDNAIRVLSATGGSTNEFIHLTAIAGRLGVTLGLDRFADIGEQTPQVLGVRPSGPFALEDFDHAGGVPALLAVLEPLLNRDVVLGDGRTVADVAAAVRSSKPRPHPCLRELDDPFLDKSGLVVLRGSLAPRGAIFKRSAAARKFWTHRGPALVFDFHNAHERAADPNLQASPDSVIVLRNAGIVGAPGMPEIDFVPIPAVLRNAGVTELVCVTDGRMSGTEGGPTALHVTPEAAVGGPIGLVRDGDEIVLDAIAGTLDLLVDEEELARRAAEAPPSSATPLRGYERLHAQHVLQADQGCDLDFLVDYDSHQQYGAARLTEEMRR